MRDPDSRPEHIGYDTASERYEATPDFIWDALDAIGDTELPDSLRDAIVAWYRQQPQYEDALQRVIKEAEEG